MSFLSRLSLSSLRNALWRMAARFIARGVAARQHAQQRFEIRGMSDHELKDLGLGRSEVQAWLRRRAPSARHGAEGTERRRAARPRATDARPPGVVLYARA